MTNETRTLLMDTADRLFKDFSSPAHLARAEEGEFPAALWQALVEKSPVCKAESECAT